MSALPYAFCAARTVLLGLLAFQGGVAEAAPRAQEVRVVGVSVSPASPVVSPGKTQQFKASVTGSTNTAVTWTCTLGIIDANGLFTAPGIEQTCTVTATSVADPTKSATVSFAPKKQVKVTLIPAAFGLKPGASQQLFAKVSHAANESVTWSCTAGTISPAGFYTAPLVPGAYKITATSVADPKKSARASVTVGADQGVTVAIDPASAQLAPKAVKSFKAVVVGDANTAVTWTASGGTITPAGVFTAPSKEGTVTLTATSAADPTKSATATVTIKKLIKVIVAPATLSLQTGASHTFTVTVQNTPNPGVLWSANGGSVTPKGIYTAPAQVGTYKVTAASVMDTSRRATATVTVTEAPVPVVVTVSPASVNVETGKTHQFSASVTGSTNTSVTWAASAGTISPTGLFTAPPTAGAVTVKATSLADPAKSAEGAVTVVAPPPSTDRKNFFTTCVVDDLDPSDRVDFENAFKAMGYANLGSNTNVTSAALKNLMERTDIGTLYHTGHGNSGTIATSGGTLSVNSLTTVGNDVFIAATCLTMTPTTWKSKMGATCRNLLGYTDYSWDGSSDKKVVKKYAEALAKGESQPKAWHTANLWATNLVDRWLVYTREASGIVEYSARAKQVPTRACCANPYRLADTPQGALLATQELMEKGPDFKAAFDRMSDASFGSCGALLSSEAKGSFFGNAADFVTRTESLPNRAESLLVAEAWMKGRPQFSGAVVDKLIPVRAVLEDERSAEVAHLVRYVRQIDDLPVRSNGAQDQILLTVSGGRVIASHISWSKCVISDLPVAVKPAILPVAQALRQAAPEIARRIKSQDLVIVDVRPCIGNVDCLAVPAYEFVTQDGSSIIVSAVTAEVI